MTAYHNSVHHIIKAPSQPRQSQLNLTKTATKGRKRKQMNCHGMFLVIRTAQQWSNNITNMLNVSSSHGSPSRLYSTYTDYSTYFNIQTTSCQASALSQYGIYHRTVVNPFTARPEKNIIRSQCMGNSQYRRQHYITYHGYKYSLCSVAGFIRQSGDYYLFPLPEISGGQGSERVKGATWPELCWKCH